MKNLIEIIKTEFGGAEINSVNYKDAKDNFNERDFALINIKK